MVENVIGYVRCSFFVPVPWSETRETSHAHLKGPCRKRLADQLRGHDETIGERVSGKSPSKPSSVGEAATSAW